MCVKYADVGFNKIPSYRRTYDYSGVGVNNIFLYGRTTTCKLSYAGVNTWHMYDHSHEISSYLRATPN